MHTRPGEPDTAPGPDPSASAPANSPSPLPSAATDAATDANGDDAVSVQPALTGPSDAAADGSSQPSSLSPADASAAAAAAAADRAEILALLAEVRRCKVAYGVRATEHSGPCTALASAKSGSIRP